MRADHQCTIGGKGVRLTPLPPRRNFRLKAELSRYFAEGTPTGDHLDDGTPIRAGNPDRLDSLLEQLLVGHAYIGGVEVTTLDVLDALLASGSEVSELFGVAIEYHVGGPTSAAARTSAATATGDTSTPAA